MLVLTFGCTWAMAILLQASPSLTFLGGFDKGLNTLDPFDLLCYRLCEDRVIFVYADNFDTRAFVIPQPTPVIIHPPPLSPSNMHKATQLDVVMAEHQYRSTRSTCMPHSGSFDPIVGKFKKNIQGLILCSYGRIRPSASPGRLSVTEVAYKWNRVY